MLTVIINVCLLKVMVSMEVFKQSATHICLCLAQLSPQLPRPCSALPSTNVPQLFYDASVFLIAGTDKDKWAPFPPAGVFVLHKLTECSPYLGVEWWKLSLGRILIWSCEHEKKKKKTGSPPTFWPPHSQSWGRWIDAISGSSAYLFQFLRNISEAEKHSVSKRSISFSSRTF